MKLYFIFFLSGRYITSPTKLLETFLFLFILFLLMFYIYFLIFFALFPAIYLFQILCFYMLRSQDLAGNSTCYEHQSCYTKKAARRAIKRTLDMFNIEHIELFDARRNEQQAPRHFLYKNIMFFL